MAWLSRSAAIAGARSIVTTSRPKALISRTLTPKSMPSLFPSPTTRTSTCASRLAVALGCAESLMPLHSAIAAARLKSIIAVDSSCWSWLSQDFAVPPDDSDHEAAITLNQLGLH